MVYTEMLKATDIVKSRLGEVDNIVQELMDEIVRLRLGLVDIKNMSYERDDIIKEVNDILYNEE